MWYLVAMFSSALATRPTKGMKSFGLRGCFSWK
jgi:hypothetical protein